MIFNFINYDITLKNFERQNDPGILHESEDDKPNSVTEVTNDHEEETTGFLKDTKHKEEHDGFRQAAYGVSHTNHQLGTT